MRIKASLIGLLSMMGALAVVDASGPPINPVLQSPPGISSMTVTFGDPGGTNGFDIDASTSSDFGGVLISSSTPNVTVTTLSVIGLNSNTTYYLRAGALYGVTTSYANTIPFSMVTLSTTPATPTGLIGVGTSPSSILWSWSPVPNVSGYSLYLATSPATLVASTSGVNYFETGLATNTSYGLFVRAVENGFLSPLSNSATDYTMANVPSAPTFTNIGSSSFTVTWSTAGNPGYTPYKLEVAPDATFSTGVTVPVPFSANLTANTTNILGLVPNTYYWVRVTAKSGDGISTGPGPYSFATTLHNSGGTTSGSGLGTATILPSNVPEGGVVTTTVTFTVPAGGMSIGGQVEVDAPPGWWPNILQNSNPTQDGYVTATTNGPASLNIFLSNNLPDITVSILTGSLTAGTTIQVVLNNIHPNCPPPNQTTAAAWEIKSAMSAADTLSDIAAQQSETLKPGPAQWLGYNPWNVLTVAANQPSQSILIQANDNCGQPVAPASPITVNLTALLPDGVTADSGALFAASQGGFGAPITSVIVPASTSPAVYYYKTSTIPQPGTNLQIRGDYLSPSFGANAQLWRSVNVLATAFTFNNMSVDNSAVVSGQKTVSISPDGSGINNFAYIRFTPSDNTTQWHVAISSNNFQTTVYENWGSGVPQGTISWDGRIYNTATAGGAAGTANSGPQVVPNGTYSVKVEVVGLVADTSLSITVNSASTSGSVTVGGSPVSGAIVTAQSTNGPGYSSTVSDAGGNYILNGLRAGISYNLYATYINPANQSVATGQLPNVLSGSSGQVIPMNTPAVIRVAAVTTSTAATTVFGNLNVNSSNYTNNYFGNLRLLAGTTTSDNGNPFNPSTWTVFYVQPGTYQIQVNMQGYGSSPVSVTNSSDVVMALTPKANVYGYIVLPSTVSYPVWASVSGTPSGSNFPTVWGGASFNVGQSSAIYSIFAVSSGTYNLLAQVNGYAPAALNNVVVTTSDSGNPVTGGTDFPTLGTGGSISGTITITGDTSGMTSPLNLWMNAYSPSLGFNVSTQVQLSTSATSTSMPYQIGGLIDSTYQMYPPYLQGFDPGSFGATNVTVTSGVGSANFTLTQETGKIVTTVKLPNGNVDYSNVQLSLQGPVSISTPMAGPTQTIKNLGTGFFNLSAYYGTTGALAQTTVNLTNGQTISVPLDLSASTYSVSGVVSIQSGFSMRNSTSTVTVNTISDLLANATNQVVYLNASIAMAGGAPGTAVANGCFGGTATTLTTARVEAFPKSFNSFGNSNRNGFVNCFAAGQYNYGVINADGSYSIPNLTPGVWEVDVYPYFDSGQTPDAAVQQQFITITNGNASGVNFALTGGNSVSGTVYLPTGVSDNHLFNVQILDNNGNSIQSTFLQVGSPANPANYATYQFSILPPGQYSLLIQDPGSYAATANANVITYVAAPVQFTINGADVTGVNVTLGYAAQIVGTLGIQNASASGATNLTLITQNNTNLLPPNFQISAQADPWIPGGNQNAVTGTNGTNQPAIDPNNHFTIQGLAAGTYDVSFQQNSYGFAAQAAGGINLASYTQGGVVVTAGQTLDLGTIILKPGISLSGTVVNTSGNPLSNIIVRATPSNSQHGQNSLQATTDANGNFTLSGLSSDLKIYDIVAAPRPGPGDSTPPVPYGQVSRLALDVTQIPAPTLNFTLTSATAQFTGRVVTADGGSLSYPDSSQVGYPAAAVYLHLEGSTSEDNPLGLENATNLDGSFDAGDLVPGIYDVTVESLGYQPYKLTGLSLTSGSTQNLGTITLQRGAELDATLAKPDGSLVNTGQVQTVVAVSPDLTSIIFGQVNKDANTGNILSLKFSGFQLSPQTYNVLLFDQQNNITSPPEGRGLVFVSSTEVITRALTYEPSAPFAYTSATRAGDIGTAVTLNYYFSRPLRNHSGDQDPSQWFTITNGQGVLSGYQLSGDRTQLTVTYTPAAGEQNATIAFKANTVDIDPSTNVEFVLNKTITLLLGQKATSESNINPALGGSVSLATSNDASNVSIPGNSLLNSDGSPADGTTSYSFTLTATDDINSIASVAVGSRTAALASLITYGPRAFVSEAYQAMNVARSDASINPLSSFYSVLLPAGLSHSLNQTAILTLSYNTAADPTQINVYYFNGTEYLLQNANRTIDTVNHTITVNVSHFSTFVVLQNSAQVVVVNGGSGSEQAIDVFNFPNPFNLLTKTETLNRGGTTSSLTTDGTIIRYFIPAAMAGAAHIDIYDVVGEKVRSIDLGIPTGDTYNYVTWDGKNDSGNKVASGLYIGILKVGANKAFWKMAVIK